MNSTIRTFYFASAAILSLGGGSRGLAADGSQEKSDSGPSTENASAPLKNPEITTRSVQAGESDEIVVTAQRREQALSDVGMSISVLGEDILQNRNVTTTADLSKLIPGFSVGETGFNTPIYTLRGVGTNEQSIGSASSVAVYVDEVPLSYPVMTVGATLDTQRIEVLKGPQGTLYGQNSTGGAINYIANKPGNRLEAGVTGSFGRFNTTSLEGYVSGPISSTLGARIAGRTDQAGNWQKSITRNDGIGKISRFAARGLLSWEPSSTFSGLLSISGWKDTSDNIIPQLVEVLSSPVIISRFPLLLSSPIPQGSARDTDWDPGKNFDRNDHFYQLALTMRWVLSDNLSITSITSFSKYKRDALIENDGSALQHSAYAVDGSITAFSQEMRLAAQFSGARWLVGGNINRDRTRDDYTQFLAYNASSVALGPPGFTETSSRGRQKVRAWAVFTNLEIPLTQQLSVTGGIRLSEDRRSFVGCSADSGNGAAAPLFTALFNNLRAARGLPPITPIAPGGCFTADTNFVPGLFSGKLRETNAPWDLTVNWKPGNGTLVYARVAKGFKSGNFATLPATAKTAYFPVVQEELLAYELGAKVRFSRALSAEAAVFRYDYDNKQLRGRISIPVFGTATAQVNIPKSRVKGAELSVTAKPLDGLSVMLSGTYISTRIKEFIGYNFTGSLVDQAGERFNFSPKYSANADLNYSREIADGLRGFAGTNLSYRSRTTAQIAAPDVFTIKPYTLLDAQLGVEAQSRRWKAWIWGKNLTNKYYWTSVSQFNQVRSKYPGMPITYGLSVSFKY